MEMLSTTVLILTNRYTRVTSCTSDSSHLIIIPKYYFKEDIEYWILSNVGYYYGELLINSSQDNRAIYIFNSEDGDSSDNVLKILEFIQHNEEDYGNLIYTFSQCLKCNQLGTLKQKFTKFNFIQNGKCEHCTNLQCDVSSSTSSSKMTVTETN